jgi:hypothetical protein
VSFEIVNSWSDAGKPKGPTRPTVRVKTVQTSVRFMAYPLVRIEFELLLENSRFGFPLLAAQTQYRRGTVL